MNDEERLKLKKMINVNDVVDQTDKIRNTKHSDLIREDVKNFMFLKNKYQRLAKSNPAEFDKMCLSKCTFLFNNYTDIYNKIKNNEIDLTILEKFLIVLKQIEDGNVDQHEGSYKIGQLLKNLYIDSALKHADKIDASENKNKKKEKAAPKPREISWKEYKLRGAAP
jgi:hypothetical protein